MEGNLMNRLMERGKNPEPEIGMGCTELMYSDRHAYTIIKMTRCTITVQRDKATRTDHNGMSDSQSYSYEPDPNGMTKVVRKTKRGWSCHGTRFRLGDRDEYYDYSF